MSSPDDDAIELGPRLEPPAPRPGGSPGADESTDAAVLPLPELLGDEAVVDATLEAASSDELSVPRDRSVIPFDPLRRYLSELRKFSPLSAEEEHQLALQSTERGDVAAAYRLVTSHLRLVVKIAFEFKRSWQNLLDLIQEGNLGLLLAVRKFDPHRGIRLSTYATWWIRAYMIKFLLDNWRLVKVGTTNARRKLLFNLRKEKDALLAAGIAPSPKLLAERMGVSEEDVIDVDRSLAVPDVSLETPIASDSRLVLADTLASPEQAVDEQVADKQRLELLHQKLDRFARDLPEREQVVFRQRLLAEEPLTLQELGDRYGLTREGLRQVEKRLLRKLREYLVEELQGMTGIGFDVPALQKVRAILPAGNRDTDHQDS